MCICVCVRTHAHARTHAHMHACVWEDTSSNISNFDLLVEETWVLLIYKISTICINLFPFLNDFVDVLYYYICMCGKWNNNIFIYKLSTYLLLNSIAFLPEILHIFLYAHVSV